MAHLSGISLVANVLLTAIDCCDLQYCPPSWKLLIAVPSRINASRQLYFSATVTPAIKPQLNISGFFRSMFTALDRNVGRNILHLPTTPSQQQRRRRQCSSLRYPSLQSLPPHHTNNSNLNRSNCKLHTKLRPPHPRRK